MLHATRRHPLCHWALAAALAALLAASTAAAAKPPGPHTPPGASRALRVRTGHASGPLTPSARALARARATHRPVLIPALTTVDSTTTADPDGRLTLTETMQPTRTLRHGRWVPLDATLHRAGRRVVPLATTAPLALSGGGSGPLAEMEAAGYTLSLSWPTPLPAPTLSGDTATYTDVMPSVPGVDLVVTADGQGGITPALEVTTPEPADPSALASIRFTASAPGLNLGVTPGGNLYATASPAGDPLFTSSAALAWDSAPLPAGAGTVTEPDGSVVAAGTGDPAASTATEPGAGATVETVATTVSGDTITLAPPASMLSSTSLTYPLYIDPTFMPSGFGATSQETHWTQVDSGFAGTSFWDEKSHLQIGYCWGGASNLACDYDKNTSKYMGYARSFFRMLIPQQIFGATITDAHISMTNKWAPKCTPTYASLYTTGPIRPPGKAGTTTFSNQPRWGKTPIDRQKFAFGAGSKCGWKVPDVEWNVKNTIQADAKAGNHDQTFGLRAPDENAGDQLSQDEWKQFSAGPAYVTMSVTYNTPPDKPDRTMSPAGTGDGGCYYHNDTTTPVIGDDDVTLYATATDTDGDQGLTTTFSLVDTNPTTGQSATHDYSVKGAGTDQVTIPAVTIAGWHPGTVHTYYWYATVTNSAGQTSPSPADHCYFTYSPVGPTAPVVTFPGSTTNPPTGQLGQTLQAEFQTGCTQGSATSPCPDSYTYQLGVSAPVTVSQSNPCGAQSQGNPCDGQWSTSTTGVSWTGNISITQLSNCQLTVVGTAPGGNTSEPAAPAIDCTKPVSAYDDGYFTGGRYPGLLLPGTNPTTPSLWLYPGTGNGTLGTPTDIGSLGNATAAASTLDGPGDWAKAQILHGDFTSDGVQDVMAYYPEGTAGGTEPGSAQIIGGYGNSDVLQPTTNNTFSVPNNAFGQGSTPPTSDFTDASLTADGTTPQDYATDLVAAGDISQQHTHYADVIGIIGDKTNGYRLDLWVTAPGQHGFYSDGGTLTPTAPEKGTNWSSYTLATAQPGCYPGNTIPTGQAGACDPEATIVFALNTNDSTLWESANADAALAPGATPGTTPTWTKVGTLGGTTPPTLVSADTIPGGSTTSGLTELWTTTTINTTTKARTATAYTTDTSAASPALTTEAATPLAQPTDDWPANDGYNDTTTTTAVETINSNTASLNGSATWASNSDTLGEYVTLDGQSGYLTPPPGTVPVTETAPTISVWFRTTTQGGVIASLQDLPIASYQSGSATASSYDPVLYVGTDGHLYAQWWNGKIQPIKSTNTVNDGMWHHAVLATTGTGSSTTQTLWIDSTAQPTPLTGAIQLQGDTTGNTNLTFGTGYTGGSWPAEPNQKQAAAPSYFQGQISGITYSG